MSFTNLLARRSLGGSRTVRKGRAFMRTTAFLSGILATAIFAVSARPSLRQAADRSGLRMGAAVRPAQLFEPAYAETLSREFNMVEPEDAFKWWIVRRNEGEFDFSQGDQIVRFAQAHNMEVRGHCLIWHRDNPRWLTESGFTSSQLSDLLHQHIQRVMGHYAGQVFAWDVVNEAFDENGQLRDSIWYNRPGIGFAGEGTEYIEQAFRWARAADPRALLFYNEAEGETLNRKSDAIYAMVKDFRKRGVPIDGVGLQLHIPDLQLDAPALSSNMARLTKLGVQVHITELDVSLPVGADRKPLHPEDLARQADVYRAVFRTCLQNPGCTAVQTWGFTDKYSWIGSHSRGARGAALLFDQAYGAKPAYYSVRDELQQAGSRDK